MNILIGNRLNEILEKLHRTFQQEKRVVLAGREGAGKSTLAREYTRRFGAEYRVIVWIDAATDETFLADLYDALLRFALPVTMTQGAANLFQTLHMYLNEQQEALLVLDHVPFAFKLQDSFEQLPFFYDFLLITHQENTPSELPRFELTGMVAEDGAQLVLRQAGLLAEHNHLDTVNRELRMAALELAREMQGSPLALHLAGGYLRQTDQSVQDYLDLFRAYPVRLPLRRSEQQALDVAGEICLAWLEQTHPEAREILQVCALLLPDIVLTVWWQQSEDAMTVRQQATLQFLIALGLLDTSEDGTVLKMHPLLQQLARLFCGLDEQSWQKQRAEQLLYHLQSLLPELEKETPSMRVKLAGHIRHLAGLDERWEVTHSEVAEVFGWAARQLWEQHLFGPAETLLRKALHIWEQAAGVSQLTKAVALEKLASLNAQLGNYIEAETLAHRALAGKMAALGIYHPGVLSALVQLGQYYAAQNKEQEAKACYEKAIAMGEKLNLRLHPVYSTAKYHLALLFIEQEKEQLAEDLLLSICVARSHILGKSHGSTLEAWLKLAEVAVLLKHWKQAYDSYQQVLAVCEEELGAEHPLVLEYLEQAAPVMFQLGKLEEARRAWQKILAVRERTGSEAPVGQISCLSGLARIALVEDKREDALEILARAEGLNESGKEATTLARAELLEVLAEAYEAGQEYDQAEQAASKALEIKERILGPEHLDLIESLSNLAKLHLALGNEAMAEKLLRRALSTYQQRHKPEDMGLDQVLKSLAEIETGRKHFDRARMYLLRLRPIRELALSEDDPRVQEIRQMLEENATLQDLQISY